MFNQNMYSNQVMNAGVRGQNGNRGGGFFVGASWERPVYKSQYPMVMRIMPSINTDDGTVDPCYNPDGSIGPAVGFFAGFTWAFEKRSSGVIQRNPQDDDWRNSPYATLYFSMWRLGQNPSAPRYVSEMTDKNNRDRPITPPEQFLPMYCKVLYRDGQEYPKDQFSELQVYVMKSNLFALVRSYLMERYMDGNPLDFTHPNKGAYLVLWNKSNPIPNGIPSTEVRTQQGAGGYSFAFTERFPSIGSSYDGMGPGLDQVQMDRYAQVFKPWDQIIKYDPDYQNQIRVINELAPANAVLYAFQAIPDWITDGCRRRAATEKPVVPGQQQMYQVQQPMYQQAPIQQAPIQQVPVQQAPVQQPQAPMPEPTSTGSAFTGTVKIPRFLDEQSSSKVPSHFGSMTEAVKQVATAAVNNYTPGQDPF